MTKRTYHSSLPILNLNTSFSRLRALLLLRLFLLPIRRRLRLRLRLSALQFLASLLLAHGGRFLADEETLTIGDDLFVIDLLGVGFAAAVGFRF